MASEKLDAWKRKFDTAQSSYEGYRTKMEERDKLYRGENTYAAFLDNDRYEGKDVVYSYNIIAENIESMVSASVPAPKVRARREKDEHLAVIIENMLRNEIERLRMVEANDLAERVIPVQGGGYYLLEWDNTEFDHDHTGDNAVTFLHPLWVTPQPGVYTSVDDMDYIFISTPTTKESVKARYGVDVSEEGEEDKSLASVKNEDTKDEFVTVRTCYYKNGKGGIGKFVWVNDTELEDLEDYQARRLKRCATCGAAEPPEGYTVADGEEEPHEWKTGDPCPHCGGTEWEDSSEEYETVTLPIVRTDGTVVGGDALESWNIGDLNTSSAPNGAPSPEGKAFRGMQGAGEAIVPYYTPRVYPIVLQRNITQFGELLGESDAEKLKYQQQAMDRMDKKIFERFLKAGTKITLPPDPSVHLDQEEEEVIRLQQASDAAFIGAYDFKGDLEQEMYEVSVLYERSRNITGVTDSYQGRTDATATSGTAKEFAAAQAAGRMESKRVLKHAAFAEMYRRMFLFKLAYADEPRPVVYQDGHGQTVYDTFSRWDFLEQDAAGNWYWNDAFLFGCDETSSLAQNRQWMWQEAKNNLASGAYGDPTQTQTLVEYWIKMEMLHYPGAAETRRNMEERLEREQMQQQMQMQAQQAQAAQPAQQEPQNNFTDADIDEMARRAALEDVTDARAAEAAYREVTNGSTEDI